MEFVEKYQQAETKQDYVTFTVTAKSEPWKKAVEKAIAAAAKDVTVKGFKKGNAPINLARNKVDMARVYDGAIRDILNPMLREVIADSGVRPLIIPAYNPVSMTDDSLTVEYTVILLPTIKVGNYKGLNVKVKEFKVNSSDIDAALDEITSKDQSVQTVNRAAKLGDTVLLDFAGYLKDKPFEGGTAQGHELVLGSGQFIPGFEEQLVGAKAGDDVNVNVTFPADYHAEELKGQAVVFKCKIHEVKETIKPVLDDEFVKTLNYPGVTNLVELRAYLNKNIFEKKEREARGEAVNTILEKVIANSDIPVYEEYVERVVNDNIHHYAEQIQKQNGATLEQWLKITGTSEDDFIAQMHSDAVRQYSVGLVVNQIISDEKIIVTEEEFEFELSKLAMNHNMEIDQLKEILGPRIDQFRNDIVNRRFEEFIIENN